MRARSFKVSFLTVLVLGAVAAPASSSTIIGLPANSNTGNCGPFGCNSDGTYQQVYTSGAFTGDLLITGQSLNPPLSSSSVRPCSV